MTCSSSPKKLSDAARIMKTETVPPSRISRNQSLPEDGDELLFSSLLDIGPRGAKDVWLTALGMCLLLAHAHPPCWQS